MGCTNSVDGGEPNSAGRPGGNKKGHGTMGKQESFRDLDQLDKLRIKMVLDYWFDEGDKDGKGNSQDYEKIKASFIEIRQKINHKTRNPGIGGSGNSSLIEKSDKNKIQPMIIQDQQHEEEKQSQDFKSDKETQGTTNQVITSNQTIESSKSGEQTQKKGQNQQKSDKKQNEEEKQPESKHLDFESTDRQQIESASNKRWDRNSNMPPQMMRRWFGGGPSVDAEITSLFKQDLVDIGEGKTTHWQGDDLGKLATIILCDQFSRNIYRGLAEAFSFDHISLKLSKQIINNQEHFKQYALFEKLFIIMPLMHSENASDCQFCADVLQHMIDHLRSEGSNDLVRIIELNRRWCLEHLEILQQFSRYPHRNKVLGRENTDEEDMYLRDANSFGQNRK